MKTKVEVILQLMQSLKMSPDFLLYVSDFRSSAVVALEN